jgi:hypothetical protein
MELLPVTTIEATLQIDELAQEVKDCSLSSIPRRMQHQHPELGRACLFRIAQSSGNGQENAAWNRSGIHNALFGISCASLDGKPHVNRFRTLGACP